MTSQEELKELKARAYDLIAQKEFIQQELHQVNEEIRERMNQAESEANKA